MNQVIMTVSDRRILQLTVRNRTKKVNRMKETGLLKNLITLNGTAESREKRREAENKEREAASAEKERQRDEYARQLQREKIELMKIKQGQITDDDSGSAEKSEYTLRQKIGAFFYCNKGMIIITSFFVLLGSFLIYDLATKPKPDFTAMIMVNNPQMDMCCTGLEEIFDQYIEDTNGNGKILSAAYYMPLSADIDPYTQQASSTKLFALMQDGDTVMVMADAEANEYLFPEDTLENLEELYPGNEHVKGYGFYPAGTSLASEIGLDEDFSEDVYIGLRSVQTGARYRDKMQANYNSAKELLDRIVERYS